MKTYHSAAYPIAKTRGLRGEFSVIFVCINDTFDRPVRIEDIIQIQLCRIFPFHPTALSVYRIPMFYLLQYITQPIK